MHLWNNFPKSSHRVLGEVHQPGFGPPAANIVFPHVLAQAQILGFGQNQLFGWARLNRFVISLSMVSY